MKLTCFQITEEAHLEAMAADTFLEVWKQGNGQFWVDVQDHQGDELETWLRDLQIPELAIQIAVETKNLSHVIPLDDVVFFEFPIYSGQMSEKHDDNYISVLAMENLLITISNQAFTDIDHLVEALTSQMKLMQASTSALVCLLLAAISTVVARMVDKFRLEVYELDERMDQDPESVDADEIREQKRKLRGYESVVNGQMLCFELLKLLDKPFLNLARLTTYFQFATTNSSAAFQSISRLDKTISDLGQRYDMNQQEKTNHRLAVLTILSAIFMPLTFIAGIYGMNFENIPELKFSWAYPVVLIGMVLIAVGMYRYFKTRGWLD